MAKQRAGRAAVPALRLAPLALALLTASSPALADWRVTPTFTISEIWTDNIDLAEDAQARSDLITRVSPGITVVNRSRRLTVDATAQANGYAYLHDNGGRYRSNDQLINNESSTWNFRPTYQGNLKGELARDLLYIDASASRGSQNISAFGPRTDGDDYSRNNRTEIDSWSISPYLTHQFGSVAAGQLRFTRDSVGGGDNIGFRRTGGDTLQASLLSGRSFRTVGWGINYTKQELSGDRYGDSSSQNLAANVRYMLSPRWSLLGNAGYDRYEYEGLGGGENGANWSVGFAWSPSLRTNLQATVGRHFYGNTASVLAVHRSRHTSWNISYSDAITTSRQQFLLPSTIDTAGLIDSMFTTAYPDPVERARAVAAYIQANGLPPSLADSVNYLSNRFMRQKLLRGSMTYRKARSTLLLSVHASDRNAISDQMSDSPLLGSQQGRLNDNVRQHGFEMNYTYRITSRSSLSAGYDIDHSKSLTDDYKYDQRTLRAAITQRYSERLRGTIELRRRDGETDGRTDSGFSGRDYTENALSATLSMQF